MIAKCATLRETLSEAGMPMRKRDNDSVLVLAMMLSIHYSIPPVQTLVHRVRIFALSNNMFDDDMHYCTIHDLVELNCW